MAKGKDAKTPVQPNGRKAVLPELGGMSSAYLPKSMAVSAARKKKTKIAMAMKVIRTVKRNDSSTPQMLSPMKITNTITHQTHCTSGGVPKMLCR